MFFDTTAIWADVFEKMLEAVLSADESPMVLYASPHYRLRFTRTSIRSDAVWNALEFAV